MNLSFLSTFITGTIAKYSVTLEHAVLLVVGLVVAAEATGNDSASKKSAVVSQATALLAGLNIPSFLITAFLPSLVDAVVAELNKLPFFKSAPVALAASVLDPSSVPLAQ
jgi:hypothetical protein